MRKILSRKFTNVCFFMFPHPSQSIWYCMLFRVLEKLDFVFCAEILLVVSGRQAFVVLLLSPGPFPQLLHPHFEKLTAAHCLFDIWFFFLIIYCGGNSNAINSDNKTTVIESSKCQALFLVLYIYSPCWAVVFTFFRWWYCIREIT